MEYQDSVPPSGNISIDELNISKRIGERNYPSLTTLVFLLILISAITLYMPFGINHQFLIQGLTSWAIFIILIIAGLRWFLSEPKLIIEKYNMKPLEQIAPEISAKIHQYASKLGLRRNLVLLYTGNTYIKAMSFGTFRHNFIVLNSREIEAYKELLNNPSGQNQYSFDVILIHELAHLISGDNWKFRLSKYIVRMGLISSIILLASMGTNRLSQRALLIGSPIDQTEVLGNLPLAFFIQAVLFYMSGLLGRVRELYADAQAKEIFGIENVSIALEWYRKIWTDNKYFKGASRLGPRIQSSPGLSFLSKGSLRKYRSEALIESVLFHKSQQEVLFAGGLTTGIYFAYFSSGGIEVLAFFSCVISVYLGVIYMLPFFTPFTGTKIEALTIALIASGMITMGILAAVLGLTLIPLGIQALLGIPSEYIAAEIRIFIAWYEYSILSGCILAIALAGTFPVIAICHRGIEKGILPGGWPYFLLLPIAHGVSLFAFIDFVLLFVYGKLTHIKSILVYITSLGPLLYSLGGIILFFEMVFLIVLFRLVKQKQKNEIEYRT